MNTPVPLQLDRLPGGNGLPPLALFLHDEQDQVISPRIRDSGLWEPYESELLLALLQPGGVFVDVGANVGYFAVLAGAQLGEQGRSFAFEPHPGNFDLLCRNIAHNQLQQRVFPVNAGLSDCAGQGELFLSAENSGDHQIYAGAESRSHHPIELLCGADYLADKVEQIDVLKVDTQGSEYRVMAGLMPLLLAQASAPCILIELTPHSLRQAGASGRQLMELMSQLDLPAYIVDHIGHDLEQTDCEALAQWCDNWDAHDADGFINVLLGTPP